MAAFGTLTLLIALVVATYAGTASLIGARRGNRRLILSGRAGVYALAAVLGLSSVALVYSFLTHDYSIKYVQHDSDASSPLFYQITAYCHGLDGAPTVLAIGDVHLENFGTWRDVESRLVWGVNDVDEACRLPYTQDLVQLATSAQALTIMVAFSLLIINSNVS